MKKLIIFFTFCYSFSFSQKIITEQQANNIKTEKAQEHSKFQFLGKGKYYGDSVVLRWSTNDAALWQLANSVGYTVERFELTNGKLTKKSQLASKLKPWSLEEWKANCKRTDTTAAMIAQILYGESKDPQNVQGNGSMDAILNKRYDMDNRFFIANMLASWHPFHAKGMALRITDRAIEKNKNYVYKIYSSIDKKVIKADTAFIMLQTFKVESMEKMPEIFVEPGDKVVKFKWSRLISEADFTGFYYERSDDNGKTYKKINKKPYLQLANKEVESRDFISVVDSLSKNYFKYYYRVVGLNYFGEQSAYSQPFEVMGKDLTPPSLAIDIKCENTIGKRVKITWKKNKIENDFIGYVIGKSENVQGPFEAIHSQLLSKTAFEYTDENADLYATNYYVVSAIDTAGNAALSLPAYVVMKDEMPPAQPTGLKGSIDSTGIIKITWNKNTELDLLGYMVYTANQTDHVFTPITTGFLADEFFADSTTLQTLTKNKYFKVVAFDKSRHASPYSEILTIKRPDRLPPIAPVFTNFLVSDSSANISWIPSSSDDVVKQLLFRKEDEKEWIVLKELSAKTNSYTDINVNNSKWYSYALVAVDDADLTSEKSFPIRLRPYFVPKNEVVKSITATLQTDGKKVKIAWVNPKQVNKERLLIYRKDANNLIQIIENLPNDRTEFIDNLPQKGTFEYGIKSSQRSSITVWSNKVNAVN